MVDTTVQTDSGTVRGEVVADGACAWRGIPYAAPPVGGNRFRAPQPPEPWDEVRECTRFGNAAVQDVSRFSPLQTEPDEDCLHLNVWSPAADGQQRPVLVWIHGGAFVTGAGSETLYDGTGFAADGDVVLVTVNYRLGVFGFLHLAEHGGAELASSGNNGLLDQIAALRWVRDNIAAFGGDPGNVTVFGESAGAISVADLLVMPAARGLFHRAIIESTAAPAMPERTAREATGVLLGELGIEPGPDAVPRLRALPAEQLHRAGVALPPMTFAPVVDGTAIPDDPQSCMQRGEIAPVPVLCGANRDEYTLFSSMFLDTSGWRSADVQEWLRGKFGPLWPQVAEHFAGHEWDVDLLNRLMSYGSFVCPTLRATAALSAHTDVWSYLFVYEHPLLKATHGLELPFVWRRVGAGGAGPFDVSGPDAVALSERMFAAWIAFARTGNPNAPGLPEWPRYDTERRAVMVFDAESEVRHDPHTDRGLWESLAAHERFGEAVFTS
ncbi:carboxylesterase/lipase family protein [Saccharopolyspora sp. HNM0983]|uniref:Carboxylic ester hydrolase n=1 Tax=Saccharopolyspora montiporae TaxID=2781240 RepID=A0A929FYQ8_9PSEU|nr:carboxylesterase/lipase family protein [Saccharopolyspora sp. HNM0983]MBE9372952.1 carboxylesterase/lipase family protein [Saccharopolyspora sp. HNM0983]